MHCKARLYWIQDILILSIPDIQECKQCVNDYVTNVFDRGADVFVDVIRSDHLKVIVQLFVIVQGNVVHYVQSYTMEEISLEFVYILNIHDLMEIKDNYNNDNYELKCLCKKTRIINIIIWSVILSGLIWIINGFY